MAILGSNDLIQGGSIGNTAQYKGYKRDSMRSCSQKFIETQQNMFTYIFNNKGKMHLLKQTT